MTVVDRYDSLFQYYGELYAVPWTLLKAQVQVESYFHPYAISPVGAQGLAQFMTQTWAQWGHGDRTNPEESIKAQASYMHWLLTRVGGKPELALAAYNGGIGRLESVQSDLTRMPQESINYVTRIMAIYQPS